MAGQFQHAGQIVRARDGGFRHDQDAGGAGERGDDGATGAGRAIHDHEIAVFPLGKLARLFAHEADQLAGVFRAGREAGVDQRAETGGGNEPLPADLFGKIDGADGAVPDADAAAFAGTGIHRENARAVAGPGCGGDGVVAAQGGAAAAADAVLGAHDGGVAAAEFRAAPDVGGEKQMQVGGIHVAVGERGVGSQRGERCRQAGLAGAALAADDDQFLHRRSSMRTQSRSKRPRQSDRRSKSSSPRA